MQIRFFTVPVHGGDAAAGLLNQFLSGHRVLSMDRSFVQDGPNSAWSFCVHFEASAGSPITMPGKRPKVDYKEVLNDQDFAVFARLRDLRKERSESEGVPAYALFTNEQLAEMVQRRVTTPSALLEISGIGDARVEKYGEDFLKLLRELLVSSTREGASKP
ncbi:MAG: ATP-dependent DNA helicase RecQ [Magnetococcales bacterium]|nr:ATP-dependent DNA helicase RecQ [Magnetococcales bacterium]